METISEKSLICKSFMFLMQLKVQQVDSYSTAKCLIAVQCGMIVYGGKFIQINSCVGRNTRVGWKMENTRTSPHFLRIGR